jgi:PAS domain S-box-containing protein
LLFSLGTFTWLQQRTAATQKYVEYITTTLTQSNELLTSLLNAETGVRGYRLTHQPEFLEPYNQAMAILPQNLDQLDQRVEDPSQRRRFEEIKALVGRRVEFLRMGVTQLPPLKKTPEQQQAEIKFFQQAKTRMDAVRAAIATFQAEERRHLLAQKDNLQAQQDLISRVLWISAGVSALGSFAAIYLISQLEKELREREQRLGESKTLIQAITTNVVDGIITLDQDGQIETINPAAARMFDYQPGEVIGQKLALLLTNPILGPTDANFSKLWNDPIAYSGSYLETVGFHKNGKSFPVEVSISEISLEQRLIAIIRDITDRQQAKDNLAIKAREMERLNATLHLTNSVLAARNQELNQFAYIASHDLKAPLRAIANLSVWLEEDLADLLPDENRQQMELMRGRVHRMEALINGLLEYSRAGRLETSPETVNVAALLEDIIETLSPPETFVIVVQPDMPTFRARRLLLRQVFANLIDNAIKYSAEDGKVTISVTEQENIYTFAVSDNGPGIDPRYHDKIFTIFQTLEARDQRESTGIGLSIVKKIVETEGGRVWIESQVGQGATFFFTWLKSSLEKANKTFDLPPFTDQSLKSLS